MLCNDVGLLILEFLNSEDEILAFSSALDKTPRLTRILEQIQNCKQIQLAAADKLFARMMVHTETERNESFSITTRHAVSCVFKNFKIKDHTLETQYKQNHLTRTITRTWCIDGVKRIQKSFFTPGKVLDLGVY